MTTYPFGYAGSPQGMGTQLTIEQYETMKTVRLLNFEFWRRVKALMEYAASQGVALGVGTGWRIQPSNPGPGFAQPGNSNHEGFPADGFSGGAVAADMVPSTSWGWMQSKLPLYGLRSFQFVNNEPWHIQPLEIPAARDFRTAPWVLQTWPLPGITPPTPPTPTPNPVTPEEDMALWARFEGEPAEIAFDATGWRVITTTQRDQLRFARLLRDGQAPGYPTILPLSWKSQYPQLP